MSVLAVKMQWLNDANILYLYPGQTMENACEVIFASSIQDHFTTITMKSEYLSQVKSKEKAIGLNQRLQQ